MRITTLCPRKKKSHKARILKMSPKQKWLGVDFMYNWEEELGTKEYLELLDEREMTDENRNCPCIKKTHKEILSYKLFKNVHGIPTTIV